MFDQRAPVPASRVAGRRASHAATLLTAASLTLVAVALAGCTQAVGPDGDPVTSAPGTAGPGAATPPGSDETQPPVGGNVDPISTRSFSDGSITLELTGMIELSTELDLYPGASFADGEMTWIQFGEQFVDPHNATVTVDSFGAAGIGIGSGSVTIIAEADSCAIDIDVTDAVVSGTFSCPSVDAYDTEAGEFGVVSIEASFSASS
jgi:hypothetical protein